MNENYNATGEIKEIGILDMMNGAIGERAAYELSRIMKNCRDLNTEAKKARTLTIKLSIVPTENRDSVAARAEVSSKLVPVKPIDGALLLGGTMDEPVVMEYTPQVPGQRDIYGGEQDEPKIIKLENAKQA